MSTAASSSRARAPPRARSISAQGSASAGGFDVSNDTSAKANLPLPLLGLRYEQYFGRDWSVGAQAAYFQLKYEKAPVKADGSLWSARVNAEYRLTRNLGVGVAIEAFSIEAEASQDDWKGGLEYSYWGPRSIWPRASSG